VDVLRRKITVFVLLLTLIFALSSPVVNFASEKISLGTIGDKRPGDVVQITGSTVYDEIVLKIFRPNMTLFDIHVLKGGDFTYIVTLPADAPDGVYTVVAGKDTDVATVQFEVSVPGPGEPSDPEEPSDPGEPSDPDEGNNGDSGSHTPNPSPTPVINDDGSSKLEINPVYDFTTKTATARVSSDLIDRLVEIAREDEKGIKKVVLEIKSTYDVKVFEQELPAKAITQTERKALIELRTSLGSLLIPSNMLDAEDAAETACITLTIGTADIASLDNKIKQQIGDRPVIEFGMKIDGKTVEWNNPGAPITVSVGYQPTEEELKNPNSIVVWYIDGKGDIKPVPNGKYDSSAGRVTFTITHFSKYAIAYNFRTFEDAGIYEWAKKPVEMVASKGIMDGTSDTMFSPGKSITRAEFIDALVKALGLTAKFGENFDDVKVTDSFHQSVGIAKKLGITYGTGRNRFSPYSEITREEMAALVLRAMKVVNKINSKGAAADLQKYTDHSKISDYAVEAMATLVREGILVGNGNIIDPAGKVTRAQTAVVISKIYDR